MSPKMKLSYWQQYCTESCFPSLRLYAQARNEFSRGFWLLITLFGFSFATLLSHCFLKAFIDSPTYLSVTGQYMAEGMEFPQMSFCFNYRFKKSKMEQYGINTSYSTAYLFHSFYSPAYQEMFLWNVSTDIVKLVDRNSPQLERDMENPEFMLALMRNLTSRFEDIIFYCTFNLRFVPNCCQFLNATVHIAPQGPCLVLKSEIKQTSPGRSGGLSIGLKVPPLEELPPTSFYLNTMDGVEIYTSSQNAIGLRNSIFIPTGSAAAVQLAQEVKENLNTPQSPCYSSTEDQASVTSKLSRSDCNTRCLLRALHHSCKCIGVNTFLEQVPNVTFCTPKQARECVKWLNTNFTYLQDESDICNSECVELCQVVDFQTRVSFSPGTRKGFEPEWAALLDKPEDGRYNMIFLMIYYADLYKFRLVERYSENWQTIISKIGGGYGLWVGTMFVGIVHILAYISSIISKALLLVAKR